MNLWFIMLLSQNKKRNKTQNKTWGFFQNMMMGFSSWNIWRSGILVSTRWFSFLQATLMTSEFSMSVAWFLVSTIAVIMGRPQSTITKQWWPSLSRVYFLVLYSLFLHVLYIYILFFHHHTALLISFPRWSWRKEQVFNQQALWFSSITRIFFLVLLTTRCWTCTLLQ